MFKLLYLKLALQNIRKNRRFYFPYLLTGLITVGMFYNMLFIALSDDLQSFPGAESLIVLLRFGSIVVGIFSTIFLLYTNSFLMKRRQKELGLYNILGMGKKHIAIILFWETVFTCLITVLGGLFFGILLSKLFLLLLFKLLSFEVRFGFSVNPLSLGITAVLFVGLYLFALLCNAFKVSISNPIELLYGSSRGEKEPKTKWLLAVLGVACVGTGYYIALTTESPISAITLFFVAVILVIIGTYCLFTAGSIAFLKLLRRNKKFYYQTRHFTAVSGMLYRMKQNAVGLANICILSTMVLVMISTSVCMYIGVEDALVSRYPHNLSMTAYLNADDGAADEIGRTAMALAEENGIAVSAVESFQSLSFAVNLSENRASLERAEMGVSSPSAAYLSIMTAEEYSKAMGQELSLEKGEVFLYGCGVRYGWERFWIEECEYKVSGWIDSFPDEGSLSSRLVTSLGVVVADKEELSALDSLQKEKYGEYASRLTYYYGMDLSGEKETICTLYEQVRQAMWDLQAQYQDDAGINHIMMDCRDYVSQEIYAAYGGLLFLGLFLGFLFLMATTLIIYYKQVSEGYEDKERFTIMQKVGLSRQEVKKTIGSQVLTVFFLPLVVAFLHLAAAFRMITKLLVLLQLTNVTLFAVCTVVTMLLFSLVYGGVYLMTSRTYYHIVSEFSRES